MKAGSFCNEVLGQKGLDLWCGATPSQERQSERAAVGVLLWGHPTCQGLLPGPSVRGAGAALPSVVPARSCSRTEYGEDGGFQPRPYLLHLPCSAPVGIPPPALLGPPVLLRRQTHWKEDLGRKSAKGKRGVPAAQCGRCPYKGKFTPRDRHTQRQDCGAGGRPCMCQEMPGAGAGAGTARTSHSPRTRPLPTPWVLDSQPQDGGGAGSCSKAPSVFGQGSVLHTALRHPTQINWEETRLMQTSSSSLSRMKSVCVYALFTAALLTVSVMETCTSLSSFLTKLRA